MKIIKQISIFAMSMIGLFFTFVLHATESEFKPIPAELQKSENIERMFICTVVQPNSQLTTALQTSIIRLTGTGQYKGTTIDLVGAIHLGDKKYYESLNVLFKDYDSVFYELVYTGNTQIPPQYNPPQKTETNRKVKANSLLGLYVKFQIWAGDVLHLVNQVEFIDYTQSNMVHADMKGEVLLQRMLANGDIGDFLFDMFREGAFSSQVDTKRFMGIGLVFARNRSQAIKRMLADFMAESLEKDMIDAEKSALIAERNDLALQKVQEALSSTPKKYAIFYGAAHLPHLYKRLKNDLNFQPVEIKWLTAWDIPVNPSKQPMEKVTEK